MSDSLYDIPILQDLPQAEMAWLLANSHEQMVEAGEVFFREGGPAHCFYITLEGELQVSRALHGQDTVLGTTPRGVIGGEISLLHGTASHVQVQAILPSRLLVLDPAGFRGIFAHCPELSARIFRIAAERAQGLASNVQQQQKMAALGKLSAGLAHELNNPAAAARRAAKMLIQTLPGLQSDAMKLSNLNLSQVQLQSLIAFQRDAIADASRNAPLSPLEEADREEEITTWLEDNGVENAWEYAPALVKARVSAEDLESIGEHISAEAMPVLLPWLCSALNAADLLAEVEQSTSRISDLVAAIKAYTYMDQASVQEVNIHQDLENTLRILKHKLRDVEVIREYDFNLPAITARGSELNQVWTNLIDNAIDATNGKGAIRLITRDEKDYVMVEVADNGSGIPKEVMPRLFEPFFTTKEVGSGTGLGLDISYRIIQQHKGTIEVWSEPGQTRFIVRLPVGGGSDR